MRADRDDFPRGFFGESSFPEVVIMLQTFKVNGRRLGLSGRLDDGLTHDQRHYRKKAQSPAWREKQRAAWRRWKARQKASKV